MKRDERIRRLGRARAPSLEGEEWRPLAGFDQSYEVSNLGRVQRIQPGSGTWVGRLLVGRLNARGYVHLGLRDGPRKMDVLLHRLVLDTFVGHRAGLTCNHKNGIKTDNRLVNLEWLTIQQNLEHAKRTGLIKPARVHRFDEDLELLGPLPWQVWNRLSQPDGMAIYDPDGFRDGRPTSVLYSEFLRARMECTLIDRREVA